MYINEDKELFKALYLHKTDIETSCGFTFDWRELPDKKASRIVVEKIVDFDDKEKWPEQFDWIMATTSKIKSSFKKYL